MSLIDLIKKEFELDRLKESINCINDQGETLLMHAAKYGNSAIITWLFMAGADFNAKDSDGWTALMLAVELDQFETTQQLLCLGADVNAKGSLRETALMLAAERLNYDITKLLIDYGAKVNERDIDGWNALRFAIESNVDDDEGRKEVLNLLKTAGAIGKIKMMK